MYKWKQLATGRIWTFHLQSPCCRQHRLKPTVCAVNAGSAPLNSAWVRRQRAHMLLSAWLSPQLRVCSEAESKTGRALESMPQVEWAVLWMLILENGRQWRCAGYIQVYWCSDTERRWFVPLKLIEDQMIKLKTDFSW